MKNIIVISTSLRHGSNSDILADKYIEDGKFVYERAEAGLTGWIDCFGKSQLKGTMFCGGVGGPREIECHAKLQEAYEMGKNA